MKSEQIKFIWKKLSKISGNILVAASIFFLIRKAYMMGIDYREYFNIVNIVNMIPVLLIFVILMIVQFYPWRSIIYSMTGVRLSKMTVSRVFLKAALMKYIPGNVFQYVGRAGLVSENEALNVTNILASVAVETAALFVAVVLNGVIGVQDYTLNLFKNSMFIVSIAVSVLVAVCIVVFLFRDRIDRLLKKKHINITFRLAGAFLFSVLFFAVTLAIQGGLLTALISIFSQKQCLNFYSTVNGAYAIGWVAGYITPGASGGIGIREAVLCMLLDDTVAADLIIVSTLAFRLINIVADFMAFGCLELIYLIKTKHE